MSDEQKRLVVLCSGGGSTQGLWRLLAERYDIGMYHPQAAQLAQELGIPGAFYSLGLFDADDVQNSNNDAARLTSKVAFYMPEIGERIARAGGASLPHALNSELPSWWLGYTMSSFQSHTHRLHALDHLARTREIAACMVHEDVSPENRSLALWAKAHGIPTIHIPHAPCHLRRGVADIHRETRAEWICASGEYMKEFYIESGHDPEKIIITGAPQWDGYYQTELPEKPEARGVVGVADDVRAICYATTWTQTTSVRSRFDEELREGLDSVIKLAHEWKAILMIKVHPNDRQGAEEDYAKIMNEVNLPALVTRNHTQYIIRAADLLVTQSPSNLSIESAIMGTPSIYIQTEGFDYRHPLPFRCAAVTLRENAEKALASKDDAAWQDFIRYYNAAHETGDASEKSAEVVEQLIQSGNRIAETELNEPQTT